MNLKFLIIILISTIVSCSPKKKKHEIIKSQSIKIDSLTKEDFITDYNLLPITENKFTGKDSIQIIYWQTGLPKIKGSFAFNNKNEKTYFKVGEFEEYHQNGKLKSTGNYEIGKYTQCCFGGLCTQFYNYKFGEWKYFYESGNLKNKVNYEVIRFPIRTSCQVGDTINFGQINLASIVNLDKEGNEVEITKNRLKKLETVVFNQEKFHSQAISIDNNEAKFHLIYKEK